MPLRQFPAMLVVLPYHVAYYYTGVHAGRLAGCIAQRPIIGSRLGKSLHQLASADRAPFVSSCACAQVAIMEGSHDLKASNIILGTYRVLSLHYSAYLMVSLLVACKVTKNGSSDGVVMFEKKKRSVVLHLVGVRFSIRESGRTR